MESVRTLGGTAMAVATFDTLKFANTLKTAGVPSQQAEAQAQAFAEVMQVNFKDLVTKDDLKHDLKDLEHRLTAKIEGTEQRLTAKIEGTGQRLTGKIDTQGAKLGGDLTLFKWMAGAALTVNLAVLGIVVRLLFVRTP